MQSRRSVLAVLQSASMRASVGPVWAVSADDVLSSGGDVEVLVLTVGQQETESSREGACKGIRPCSWHC